MQHKNLIELAALAKFADDNFDSFENEMVTEHNWTLETVQSFLRDHQYEIATHAAELEKVQDAREEMDLD